MRRRFHGVFVQEMDILLLGCCTRFLFTLIKLYSQLANITIPLIQPLYHISSSITEWTNCLMIKVHDLNWRQIFPWQYIHVFYIHYSGCSTLSSPIHYCLFYKFLLQEKFWGEKFLIVGNNRFIIAWMLHHYIYMYSDPIPYY